MSLDSLFEQIILTEQQVSENTKQLHEVKAAIKSAQDKISSSSEQLEKARLELDEKEKLKRETSDEREKFLKEMITFNSEFNLVSNRNAVLHSQTRSKIQSLELEAEALHKELNLLKEKHTLWSSMEAEKRSLEAELEDIKSQLTDTERHLREAVVLTENLKAERHLVRQKPLTDSTCIRLKKELEFYKEDELELLRETLSSEIRSLRQKLSQKGIVC